MDGEEDELKKSNGMRSSQIILDWLEAHHADMLTALRPFAGTLSNDLGSTSVEVASELLVEVTRRALENPTNYDPTRPPQAWLLGIAKNVVLEWRDREIKWQTRYKNTPYGTSSADPDAEDPIERLLSSGVANTDSVAIGNVWTADILHQAPEPHQEIIKVFMATDFDTEETASVLGINPVNVRQRLFRARKWFKDRLYLTQENLSHGGSR